MPIHDERGLFEFLCLEAMQCGLSWSLIYSLLQAAGVVNDHSVDCPRHEFLVKHFPTRIVPRDEEDPS